jgi:hypothetical protein
MSDPTPSDPKQKGNEGEALINGQTPEEKKAQLPENK